MVFGHNGPAVSQFADLATASVEHGLYREGHARDQHLTGPRSAVVKNLRFFMKAPANSVPTEFPHDRKSAGFGVSLNYVSDIAQSSTRLDLINAQPETFVSRLTQASGRDRRLTDHEHPAGIPVPPVFDDRDVQIDDIPGLEHPVTWNAMAHLMVDRRTDRFGVGLVAWRAIVQGCRNRRLHFDHIVVAKAVEFSGCDPRLDMRSDEVKNFRGKFSCRPHGFKLLSVFDRNRHGCKVTVENVRKSCCCGSGKTPVPPRFAGEWRAGGERR